MIRIKDKQRIVLTPYEHALSIVLGALPLPEDYQGELYKDGFNNYHFVFHKVISKTSNTLQWELIL